jgi:plastocyanin
MAGMRSLRTTTGALLVAVALLGLVACGDDDDPAVGSGSQGGQGAQTTEISLRAGLNAPNDPTIAVEMYLPETITVTEGTTVSWTIAGPEPHSVTFLPPGQTMPSPESPEGEKLFAPTPAASNTYDGRSLVNSGLVPLGPQVPPPFKLTFPNAGTFKYGCVIHPQMIGTVNVVARGGRADAQADVQTRGDNEARQWITEGENAKRQWLPNAVKSQSNPDGTTTWTVEMGTQSPHTDILAFGELPATVKPRDRVVFVNNSVAPHTASFAGRTQLPQDPTSPQVAAPAPGPSPQTLNATDFFNTGLLPPNAPPGSGPPLPVRSFTFVVPAAGSYPYVCILHLTSGMASTIRVA